MNKGGAVLIAGLLASALTACGAGTVVGFGQTASAPTSSEAAASHGPTSSSASAGKPLSYYAAQYLRTIGPLNSALDNLPDNATQTQLEQFVFVIRRADNSLLREQWPSAQVTADVQSLVRANGPVIGDLMNDDPQGFVRDQNSASAAADIVRADLGLPPANVRSTA